MLQLSGYLMNKPVLSLRTGGPVAWVTAPIINPKNLKIEGFYCTDSRSGHVLILLSQDIRDLTKRGFIADDHSVLADPEDLVRLQDILHMDFQLLKKPVVTTAKEKVGKVSDYAAETSSMYLQKLYVARPFWKSLTGGPLSVDRTQVAEVTNRKIIINELVRPTRAPATAVAA